MSVATDLFRASRDQLLDWYGDHEAAVDGFRFPAMPSPFNWVIDWFDEVAAATSHGRSWSSRRTGRHLAHVRGAAGALARRVGLARHPGRRRGDSVILMLGNQVELWESMLALISSARSSCRRRSPSAAPTWTTASSGATRGT